MKQHARLFSALAVGLVLLLNLLAVAPSLHEFFHPDAAERQHECAVTLFAHGVVSAPAEAVALTPLLIPIGTCPVVELSPFSPSIDALPAGRAPPVSSAVS